MNWGGLFTYLFWLAYFGLCWGRWAKGVENIAGYTVIHLIWITLMIASFGEWMVGYILCVIVVYAILAITKWK